MHGHIHAVGPNPMNTYSARALDKNESAQRAAEVRKKLLGAAGEIEVEPESDATWMAGRSYEAAGYGGKGRPTYAKHEAKPDSAEDAVEPISVWA